MKNHVSVIALGLLVGFSASIANAQDVVFNDDSVATAVTDLQDQITEDTTADQPTFGNNGRTVGTYGSVALRGSISNSNIGDDVTTLGIGANYGFYDGKNGSELNLSYAYATTNGVEEKNNLAASYDYTRDLNDRLFGYANMNLKFDNLASTAVDPTMAYQRDAFVGFGLGYRLVDNGNTTVAVKAGPGYRFLEDGNGLKTSGAAYSVEADLFQRFSETVFLSNALTLVGSETDTSVTNELALNVALSNALALRTSYIIDFNGADIGSMTKTDDTFGVSVVYNFN
jgi:putative salt-induced outer membrane protein